VLPAGFASLTNLLKLWNKRYNNILINTKQNIDNELTFNEQNLHKTRKEIEFEHQSIEQMATDEDRQQ
jgi:hypothetical protein